MKKFKSFLTENQYIKAYTEPGGDGKEPLYRSINRKSGDSLTPKESEHYEGIKDYISNNRIDKDTSVYRGQGHSPGKTFTTKGITSSSPEYDGAYHYAENHKLQTGKSGHIVKMNFNAGDNVSHDIGPHSLIGEPEHLIHPGIKMKLTKSEYNKEDDVYIHHYEVDR